MKYARDVLAVAGGGLIALAAHLTGAAHWVALLTGALFIATVLTTSRRNSKH